MRSGRGCATVVAVDRTVLIVDDHAAFRSAARGLLEAGGFAVVGEAADGAAALEATADLRPAIVLLDVCLPDLDGFAVAARLVRGDDPPAVVLTSSRDPSTFRRRLAAQPALTFIPKSELSATALWTAVAT